MDVLDTPGNSTAPAPFWNTVLRYGGLSGLASIVISVLYYLLDVNMMSMGNMIMLYAVVFAVSIGFAIASIKFQRDTLDGGYIKFGRALLIGMFTTLVSSVISAVWNYILINFIDPGYVDKLKDQFVAAWGDSIPPERMDKALEGFEKAGEILTILKNGIGGGLFIGLIVGLIAAAIMKRERPLT